MYDTKMKWHYTRSYRRQKTRIGSTVVSSAKLEMAQRFTAEQVLYTIKY